jgi:hypothetical protein
MDNGKPAIKNINPKKEFRNTILTKLESAFAELGAGIKEKRFRSAIKRASKLLASDLYVKTKKVKKQKKGKKKSEVPEGLMM